MKVVIASSHYRRSKCSAVTSRALSEQVGIEDFHYVASIDPSTQWEDVQRALVKYVQPKAKSFKAVLRDAKPSCNGNIKHSLSLAMELEPDFIIHLEDDVLLGVDALPYMLAVAESFAPDTFTVGCWEHPNVWGKPPQHEWRDWFSATNADWFCAWGWGAKAIIVKEMLAGWPADDGESWDLVVRDVIRKGRPSIHPFVSRAQNIGANGTHRGENLVPFWIGGPFTHEHLRRLEASL